MTLFDIVTNILGFIFLLYLVRGIYWYVKDLVNLFFNKEKDKSEKIYLFCLYGFIVSFFSSVVFYCLYDYIKYMNFKMK